MQNAKNGGSRPGSLQVPKPVLARGEAPAQGEGRMLTALGGKTSGKPSAMEATPRSAPVSPLFFNNLFSCSSSIPNSNQAAVLQIAALSLICAV